MILNLIFKNLLKIIGSRIGIICKFRTVSSPNMGILYHFPCDYFEVYRALCWISLGSYIILENPTWGQGIYLLLPVFSIVEIGDYFFKMGQNTILNGEFNGTIDNVQIRDRGPCTF